MPSNALKVERVYDASVAIDGVDAAGKTTLADELVTPLERAGRSVIRASIDGFHNPAVVRYQRGDKSPEGYFRDSFNYAGLIDALLDPLGPGGDRCYRRAIFAFRKDLPVDSTMELAVQNSILIFDGVFLLRPELRAYWDFSIFLRATFDVTMTRAETRDSQLHGSEAIVRQRYEERYVPGQQLLGHKGRPVQSAQKQ
ncbi:MAG: uridine kinase [Blastocatellia bacterium]